MSLESQRERKICLKNNVPKIPKFGERYKPADYRSAEDPKQNKYKENHAQAHESQTAGKKISKAVSAERLFYWNYSRVKPQNQGGQKIMEQHLNSSQRSLANVA